MTIKSFFANIKIKCANVLTKFADFCCTHRKNINFVYFISIIVYFFLVFLPNITTNTPLSFINFGIIKIIYRILIAIIFGIISVFAFFANRIKANKLLIYFLIGFFVFLLIGSLFNLKSTTAVYFDNYYEKVVITSSTGLVDLLTYYGNTGFSYIFCFALFTCIPVVLNEKKRLLILLDSFVILMSILCVVSYIKDFNLYVAAIKFDYNQYGMKDISSLFASKNSFGVFLFHGLVVALVSHHYHPNFKYRFLYLVAASTFFITLFFTLCKDAIFAAAIFIIVFFVYFVSKKIKKKRDYIFVSLWLLLLVFVLTLLMIIIFQQQLIDDPFFKKLFYFLGANPVNGNDNALFGRLEIVLVFFVSISGIHYLVGYGHSLPGNAYIWSLTLRGEGNENLHNTFIHMFGTGGVFYFIFYIFLLIYVFKLTFRIKFIDKKIYYLIFGLLLSQIFYSLFETSILFLSGSSATMLLSILLITLLSQVIDNKAMVKDNSVCEVTI